MLWLAGARQVVHEQWPGRDRGLASCCVEACMGAVLQVDGTVQRLTCCAEGLSTGLLV